MGGILVRVGSTRLSADAAFQKSCSSGFVQGLGSGWFKTRGTTAQRSAPQRQLQALGLRGADSSEGQPHGNAGSFVGTSVASADFSLACRTWAEVRHGVWCLSARLNCSCWDSFGIFRAAAKEDSSQSRPPKTPKTEDCLKKRQATYTEMVSSAPRGSRKAVGQSLHRIYGGGRGSDIWVLFKGSSTLNPKTSALNLKKDNLKFGRSRALNGGSEAPGEAPCWAA